MHAEIDLVRYGFVGEIVLAGDGQPEVRARHDGVVVLDHHVVQVTAKPLLPYVALQIVVSHFQLELQRALHVLHARIRRPLHVHLPVEQFARLDPRHHVPGTAIYGHVVARAQLVRRSLRHVQIRFLETNQRLLFLSN